MNPSAVHRWKRVDRFSAVTFSVLVAAFLGVTTLASTAQSGPRAPGSPGRSDVMPVQDDGDGGGATSAVTPGARFGHIAIYDPPRQRMIVWGGIDEFGDDFSVDVWALSLPSSGSPTWTKLTITPGSTPPGVAYLASAVYDSNRDRILIFGGGPIGSGSSDVTQLTFNPTNPNVATWTAVTTFAPVPPSNPAGLYLSGHSAIYDPIGDRMIVFGGWALGARSNLTWQLTFPAGGTPTWSPLPTSGTPAARYGHTATYDPVARRMIVIGGDDGTNVGAMVRLSMLALDGSVPAWWTDQWTYGGLPPSWRYFHTAVYDPPQDRIIVFDGISPYNNLNPDESPDLLNVLWIFRDPPPYTSWAPYHPSTPGSRPPFLEQHAAIFDPVGDRMILFGGIDYDRAMPQSFGQTWQLGPLPRNIQLAQWTRILTPGEPASLLPSAGNRLSTKQVELSQNAPNPVTESTTIGFSLAVASSVRLEIFDLSGRRVNLLADGTYSAGSHQLKWDRLDGSGRRVSPGVYLYRLQVGGAILQRKMAVVAS